MYAVQVLSFVRHYCVGDHYESLFRWSTTLYANTAEEAFDEASAIQRTRQSPKVRVLTREEAYAAHSDVHTRGEMF